ncbi:MAG: hypothetical protein H6734_27765 [Alphaproteobacteria bacterium]|nr:hypothetical protein [Alphaproteobacteria bacterium]
MLRYAIVLALVGCPRPAPVEPAVAAPPPTPQDDVLAVTWVQTSAEADAVALTVFHAAGAALDLALGDPTWTAALEQEGAFGELPPAIVVDVDETVLDNSPYQVRNLLDGHGFDKASWGAWVDEGRALAVPGAPAFLSAAAEKGVDVFYVSNRDASQAEATRGNLAAQGFPDAEDTSHLLFRPAEGDRTKAARRRQIVQTHRIVLMFGDNLFDFVEGDKPDRAAREAMVAAHTDWWGARWFMLPNPMYGSWDDAVQGYAHPDAPTAHAARIEALDGSRP